ncbi:hypothetical protein GLAREA_01001 [Glarea lozoyensis ATCC 20868]|uniref:Uncharacterized protein n=1 Tax=Glarea lozoyensis (strain ATCC 20868 / MF5171) TaxID=1116229 RepID=S3DCY4_GLAL2|nr:uncharacterized protein GLAREA_01001 [Glarea lozoyensis ATCC 20868]EPE29841.1 hypothetical protein GLAREA_01001 [Glarea lozoyensis ATCC 20868]
MAPTTFSKQSIRFSRGGYNGPSSSSEDEDNYHPSAPVNFNKGINTLHGDNDDEEEDGRGGYNKGGKNKRGDDDEEEDGRGGYN